MPDELLEIIEAPEFIQSFLHLFFSVEELRLLRILGRRALSCEELAELFERPRDGMEALLADAYRRRVLGRDLAGGSPVYRAGSFYDRLDSFCKFGNYGVLPRSVRQLLDQWCFQEYLNRNDNFQLVVNGAPEYQKRHSETILLLREAEQLVDSAPVIRVVPCNCKMLADHCDHSREICLALDPEQIDERTGGRELAKDEAKQLLRQLDREGLIHTAPYHWQETGRGYLCNCCTCCCYPFRAAKQLGAKGRWPQSRYLARHDHHRCRSCGLCARRCPFGAFQFDREQKLVSFDPGLCWGCGLCANRCPEQAIEMNRI
jgi:Pyruvate/2-oxoacid:ferredoxin oxidoreductase delta subunit